MHSGTITRIAEPNGRLGCVYVDGKVWKITYAHLHVKPELQVGNLVLAGEVIGYVSRKLSDPHLHLEVLRNNKAVSGRTPHELAAKIAALIP